MGSSALRRHRGREPDRGGAGDLAGAGAVVDIQRDLALEHHRALDHRAGADHDARLAAAQRAARAVARLFAPQAALDPRTVAHGDVAGHGLDAAGQFGPDDADAAGDGLDVAADLAAAVHEHVAADRLEIPGDAGVAAHFHVAADAGQRLRGDAVAGVDVAAHAARILDAGVVSDLDVAAHGFQVAVRLAGFGGDVAADPFDALLCLDRECEGAANRGGQGRGNEAVAVHGSVPVGVCPIVMRRIDDPFRQYRYNRRPRTTDRRLAHARSAECPPQRRAAPRGAADPGRL